ncbi:MAG: MBL fold metallo-hydrolase [Chloroflexi bacterium]|nr:MBL fold metallo-hydrolase [Chloroflexota bacterium]
MAVRVVGAHNMETPATRHTCFLIDGVMGIDAGSLASALGPEECCGIHALLLTHAHFDHCRDLPTLGLATFECSCPTDVYGLPETLESVKEHLLDGRLYPDFTQSLNGAAPKYRLHSVQPSAPFQVLGYTVEAVPAHHPVPAVGYIVKSGNGVAMGFTGDTDGDLLPFLQKEASLQVLFVDVTFPNRLEPRAKMSGHLTPALLGQQLGQALERGLRLPRIVPVHLGVGYQEELLKELGQEASRLGIDLRPAFEDMVV